MEQPEHRESDAAERAAERAADATDEPRRRRGKDEVRIEDGPRENEPPR